MFLDEIHFRADDIVWALVGRSTDESVRPDEQPTAFVTGKIPWIGD